jgi:alpha-glucosidase (family GH31 glycosyl hydrolase)
VSFFDSGILNIKWSWADPTGKRRVFGVPDEVVNTTARDLSNLVDTLDRHIVVYNEPCFRLEVKTRISPSNTPTVFTLKGFMFHEYLNWLQVEAQAEATETEDEFRGIFGLGERSQKDFFMKSGVYPMWATDQTDPLENGRLPGKQVYGSHPFYMWKHSSNNWIGVYHNNANAQDWWIDNDFTSGKVSIQQIATGGLSDLYIMLPSQNPDGVVAKYHSLVGTPVLTPQWALGWHQCKWCYRTLQDVVTSLSGYLENQIPLDAQWIDIDYMQDYKDFTYNQADYWGQPGAFFGLQEFIDFLHHELNMRFVPIIDAGISYRPNEDYAAFDEGVKQGVFLKEADGSLSYGKVWANEAVFPDFSNPQANTYWIDQLDRFSKIIEFDGLWEDMNEASNFCRGKCFKDDLTPFDSIANRLPYTPTGKRLDRISLALDAKMNDSRSQLDAHSFYGTSQSRASSLYY